MKWLSFAFLALLVACSGGSGGDAGTDDPIQSDNNNYEGLPDREYALQPASCDVASMRSWIDANMRDYYLFHDQVPRLPLENYTDYSELVDALRVNPPDRFSYITETSTSDAYFEEGRIFGFGHSLMLGPNDEIMVAFSFPDSPFAEAGFDRGDQVIAINNKDPFSLTDTEFDALFGTNQTQTFMSFTVREAGGAIDRTIVLQSRWIDMDTVVHHSVHTVAGESVGYMVLDGFIRLSETEIDVAFAEFSDANVSELILDLRYNGGGRLGTANYLATKIIGNGYTSRDFVRFEPNSRYAPLPEFTDVLAYDSVDNPLNLNRLVVLTTGGSCSASETVINSLRPFMEVVTIGDTTCGKPYASAGRDACGQSMYAVQWEMVNDAGAGGYYNGIAADCSAADDLTRAFGDPNETMLATALSYLENQSCSIAAVAKSEDKPDRRSRSPAMQLWNPRPAAALR